MKDTAFITFGCSWTFGEGSGYEEGMTLKEYEKIQHDEKICWENGWRKHVVDHFNFGEHLNFGVGGSSNDKQFRLAKQFFVSKKFKDLYQKYKNIIVLWGITSVTRYDVWIKETGKYEHIFLKDSSRTGGDWNPKEFGRSSDWMSYYINKFCHWEPTRIRELEREFLFWNQYFKLLRIKNYWYDTFSSFKYNIYVPNFFDMNKRRRDMLAQITNNHRNYTNTPKLIWGFEDFPYAVKNNLINPYSYHPKKDGYKLIGKHLISKLEEHI